MSVIDIYSKFVWMVTSNEKNGFAFINRERSKIWLDKAVNFIIDQWNHGYNIMIYRCVHHKMKENVLLLKDVLAP